VRIDSIEEAILDSGVLSSPINDAGYRVGNAVAADNLHVGRTVIADSVNPNSALPRCLARGRETCTGTRR